MDEKPLPRDTYTVDLYLCTDASGMDELKPRLDGILGSLADASHGPEILLGMPSISDEAFPGIGGEEAMRLRWVGVGADGAIEALSQVAGFAHTLTKVFARPTAVTAEVQRDEDAK